MKSRIFKPYILILNIVIDKLLNKYLINRAKEVLLYNNNRR